INHESIYETHASPFKKLAWGRCTQKPVGGGTRLYLHVFDWPSDGKLVVPGLGSQVTNCFALANKKKLKIERVGSDYIIDVSNADKQNYATVIVTDIKGKAITGTSSASFEKVISAAAMNISSPSPGIHYSVYEGEWSSLPDFNSLKPAASGISGGIDISSKQGSDNYGFVFDGLVKIPADGVYNFYISSDDGSKLFIDEKMLIDNDGLHGMSEKNNEVPLSKGYHKIKILFFERSGGDDLQVQWQGAGFKKQMIPSSVFFRE